MMILIIITDRPAMEGAMDVFKCAQVVNFFCKIRDQKYQELQIYITFDFRYTHPLFVTFGSY